MSAARGRTDEGAGTCREPGDTPGERACRRSVCWLTPVFAAAAAIWVSVTNYGEPNQFGRQIDQLRPDGFGVFALYAFVLAFGAPGLGGVALLFRPRTTRWLSGGVYLLLSVGKRLFPGRHLPRCAVGARDDRLVAATC